MKKRKFVYLSVLQMWTCCGWEDLICADCNDPEELRQFKSDVKAYRENQPGAYRVIHRREPNNA